MDIRLCILFVWLGKSIKMKHFQVNIIQNLPIEIDIFHSFSPMVIYTGKKGEHNMNSMIKSYKKMWY